MKIKMNRPAEKPEKKPDPVIDEVQAFVMDADRLERVRQRELAKKNKTPEQIKKEKLEDEQNADLDKVVEGKMTKEEFKKKWKL